VSASKTSQARKRERDWTCVGKGRREREGSQSVRQERLLKYLSPPLPPAQSATETTTTTSTLA